MSYIMKCDACGREARKDGEAALYVSVTPALGQGVGHACSPECSENVAKSIIDKIREQVGRAQFLGNDGPMIDPSKLREKP